MQSYLQRIRNLKYSLSEPTELSGEEGLKKLHFFLQDYKPDFPMV